MPQMKDYKFNATSADEDFDFEALANGNPPATQNAVPEPEEKATTVPGTQGKPAKANKSPSRTRKTQAAGSRKTAHEPTERKCVSVYIEVSEHKRFKRKCLDLDTSMQEVLLNAARDYLEITYVCAEANCASEFTLHPGISGDIPEPTCCPVCGSRHISAAKR